MGTDGSSLSNIPVPIRRRWPRCSSAWGSPPPRRATVRRMSPSTSAFRVADAAKAYERAIALGTKPVHAKVGPMELNIPAIEGISGLIYLADRYGDRTICDVEFVPLGAVAARSGLGL